jgi:hypothetical protein
MYYRKNGGKGVVDMTIPFSRGNCIPIENIYCENCKYKCLRFGKNYCSYYLQEIETLINVCKEVRL